MKLLLLGARGSTSHQIVAIALERGHHVSAFVRSPDKVERRDSRLTVVGSPLREDALVDALRGHDAVLSTLGLPPRLALRPSTFMTESVTTTTNAMTRASVSRLVILSAAVLFPGSGLGYAFFSWMLKHHARDLRAMEDVVEHTSLSWTIARPPRLRAADDARYAEKSGALPTGSSTATYRAVASFMLDAAERSLYEKQIVGLVTPS